MTINIQTTSCMILKTVLSQGNPQTTASGNQRGQETRSQQQHNKSHNNNTSTATSTLFQRKGEHLIFSNHHTPSRETVKAATEGETRHSTAMVGVGLFDLEDQFAFYGAYHSNKVNVITHVICVWPLLFGGLLMLAYTNPLAPQLPFMAALPFHEYMTLNYCFVACAVYAFFYVSLEYKSGFLAALLVLFCWLGANAVAMHYPYTAGWKIAAVIEFVGWTAQFITHGYYEKRSPALVENLVQACLLAPYFVMREALHSVFHYEPYAGFNKNVQYLVNQRKADFRAKKAKGKHRV